MHFNELLNNTECLKKVRCSKLTIFYEWCKYQFNTLRHNKYNFQLGVCKWSIQYVNGYLCYHRERDDGSKWTWMIEYACV